MLLQMLSVIDLNFIILVLVGSMGGLLVGAIPGLSVTMATALLVSITFSWSVKSAIAVIMGVYVSGVFAGAVSAILINIPGAPAAVATTLDGFPMAQKGEASEALWAATFQSFIGTIFGLLVLSMVAKPITSIALAFSPLDYFLLALFGLTTVGSLTSKSFIKGLISALLGIMFSLVGMDPIMGSTRFTFGSMNLQAGIALIPVLIGLFGFSEVLTQVGQGTLKAIATRAGRMKIDIKGMLKYLPLSLRSAAIGTIIGALPGAGGPVASLIAYDQARKTVKNPSRPFGEGAVEGIVASEAANNACVGGALIPMLTLAIPGDAVTAVILAAFYVHGLRPGPLLFLETPELFSIILAGGFLGAFMMLLLGVTVVPQLARVVLVPKKILMPVVTVLCVIGAYAVNSSLFEVLLMIIFGFLGFVMRQRNYSVAPMVLGLVLGGIMDSSLRRAINLAEAGDSIMVSLFMRPISLTLLVLIIISIMSNIPACRQVFSSIFRRRKTNVS